MNENETAVAVVEPQAIQLGTLRADSARGLVAGATEMANALRDVIKQQRLTSNIQGREFVRVEGWLALAAMLGVLPREVSVVKEGDIYVATVELVRSDGHVLTRASSECGGDESTWAKRPAYARRSMAITRATGKACRIAFSWVMALAGYETTPAEEMMDLAPEGGSRGFGPRPAAPPERRREPERPAEPMEAPAGDAITEAQARRMVAIARETGEKHGEHGFHVLQSVLKAHDIPLFGKGTKMDGALLHLCEHVGTSVYEDLCAAVEAWEPRS